MVARARVVSLLITLILVLLFPVGCTISLRLLMVVVERQYREPVGKIPPETFPVLVITRGRPSGSFHADVVYSKNLEEFLRQHADYTYLVPEGLEQTLREEVEKKSREKSAPSNFDSESPVPWYATFRVHKRSAERQTLEVTGTWDDDRENVGWYEATDKAIFPKEVLTYFGPGTALGLLPVALLITSSVYGLGFWISKKRKARQSQGSG